MRVVRARTQLGGMQSTLSFDGRCVIAWFEVLKYRRKCARDRMLLSAETIQLLSADAEDRYLVAERKRQALEDCLAFKR